MIQEAVDYLLSSIFLIVNYLGITTGAFQNTCVILVITFLFISIINNYNIINRCIPSYPYNPAEFSNSKLSKPITMEKFINENIPEFQENSWSILNPFLFNGHLQTIYAGLRRFRYSYILYFTRQIIIASDGGCAALDRVVSKEAFEKFDQSKTVYPKEQPKYLDKNTRYMTTEELEAQDTGSDDSKAIVITLTGLSGSSAESYIRCLYKRLSENPNFELYVLNSRGCGNVKLTTPKLFCALWTEDVRNVIQMFKKKYPNRKIYLIGFSLGSIIMGNYLAQEGDNSNVELGIALASIWDLRGSSYFLENGFISSLLYSTALTFPLMMLLKSHSNELLQNPVFKSQYTNNIIRSIWKLKEFDNVFTSKMFGFTCADDYYTEASPIYKIKQIKTPFLNLSALDDPITGGLQVGALPLDQAKYNPYISMVNTTLGGHVGMFKWNNDRWYAKPLAELIIKFHEDIVSPPGYEIHVDKRQLPKPVLIDGKLPVIAKNVSL